MPSIAVTKVDPVLVLEAKPYKGVTLQNMGENPTDSVFISWTGDKDVVEADTSAASPNSSGFELEPGAIIDIADEFKGALTTNKEVWAVAAAAAVPATVELRYFVR
jgi:hypothetical protein